MMKLQQQCCTIEQGQRLVELGVNAPATFYHMPSKSGPHGSYIQYGWHGDATAPAYTIGELGQMLDPGFFTMLQHINDEVMLRWVWEDKTRAITCACFPTEAQARADALIYALENNFITADVANKRLNA